MEHLPPVNLPPASGDCVTEVKGPQPNAKPQQFPSKMFRSADGKTRVDCGDTSVISDPKKGESIVLDHVKKEARVSPISQVATPPEAPKGSAPAIGAPGSPVKVEDLGKKLIDGHEVEGKKYTHEPPKMPKPPAAPKPPDMPKMALPKLEPPKLGAPGMPKAPPPPGAPPAPPPVPAVSEVWTSTKTKLPVLTKMTGPFGEQTCKCKYKEAGDPPASLFQIPADYKKLGPIEPPAPPKVPSLAK